MPMQNKHVRDWINERAEHVITLDGYDDAVVGVAIRCGSEPVVVYDRERIISICMTDGMTREEAEEWVSFNIEGAFVGELTPWIMTMMPKRKRQSKGAEVKRLLAALAAIAENNDEPSARDFAREILANREVP